MRRRSACCRATKPERFAALAIPGLLASGIPQLTMIAGTMIASDWPGAVSFLYYANRLVELPLGIVGIAIGTVMTPALSHAMRGDDRELEPRTMRHGIELSLGLAMPAAIGADAAGLADRAHPVRARRFHRTGQFVDRGDAGGLRHRPARPCAGQGAVAGFLCARGYQDADAGGAGRPCGRRDRQPGLHVDRPADRDRLVDCGLRMGRRRHAVADRAPARIAERAQRLVARGWP